MIINLLLIVLAFIGMLAVQALLLFVLAYIFVGIADQIRKYGRK